MRYNGGILTFPIKNSNKRLVFLQLLYKDFASFTQLFTVENKRKMVIIQHHSKILVSELTKLSSPGC